MHEGLHEIAPQRDKVTPSRTLMRELKNLQFNSQVESDLEGQPTACFYHPNCSNGGRVIVINFKGIMAVGQALMLQTLTVTLLDTYVLFSPWTFN